MDEHKLKEAFQKIKQDINFLKLEITKIKELLEVFRSFREIPTIQQINPTHPAYPTHNPTVPLEAEGLKSPNLSISTGNRGVPTDRQTDRQTDNPTHFSGEIPLKTEKSIEKDIQEASEILDSLDALKKEIRLKFKRITPQEMLIFSTIYQLEEQTFNQVTYKQIALKLGLSESSVRDYTNKIIKKGIPIRKYKLNNKQILLSISPDLKKIATLSTIVKLREI